MIVHVDTATRAGGTRARAMRACLLSLALFASGALPAAATVRDPPDLPLCDEARDIYYGQSEAAAATALALQKECLAKERVHDGWLADEYRSLGYYEHAVGHYAEAVAAFDEAIRLYGAPNSLLLGHRGMAKLELGQLDAARADFDAALLDDRISTIGSMRRVMFPESFMAVSAARAAAAG